MCQPYKKQFSCIFLCLEQVIEQQKKKMLLNMIFHVMYILVREVRIDGYNGRREAIFQILCYFRHNIICFGVSS